MKHYAKLHQVICVYCSIRLIVLIPVASLLRDLRSTSLLAHDDTVNVQHGDRSLRGQANSPGLGCQRVEYFML